MIGRGTAVRQSPAAGPALLTVAQAGCISQRSPDCHRPPYHAARETAMAQRQPTREDLIQQDISDLHRLGYAQQLFREMGGFSNFAISFSIISILTGAVL